MWTYLAIFFSILVLLLIFARRFLLLKKPGKLDEKEVSVEGDGGEAKKDIRVPKGGRAQIEALFKRGEAMLKAGKDEEAIKCFVQVLAIDNKHLETLHKLAMLYLQKQMYSAAAALFKQLAELTADAVHYSHLGLALFQQSDYEAAKLAYQKALQLDDSRPQRFISLAQVYRALGQLNNALIAVNKALAIEAENFDFLFLLADLQIEIGNLTSAASILENLLNLDAENAQVKAALKDIKSRR